MDTSKEYIEMCWKAREIQDNWIPKEYDVWYRYNFDEYPDYGTEVARDNDGYGGDVSYVLSFDSHTWLPRQDQLFDMIHDGGLLGDTLIYLGDNGYADNYDTLEKLYLSVFMFEEFSKEWNGKSWK